MGLAEIGILILLGFFLILVILITILDGLTIYYFLRKYISKRKESDARFELGMAIFFIINPIGLFIKIITGTTLGSGLPIHVINIMLFIGGEIALISLIVVLYVVENQIWKNKTGNLFTLIYYTYFIIMTVVGVITQFTIHTMTNPFSYILIILATLIPVFYIYLGVITGGGIRRFSFYFAAGFGLIFLGAGITFIDLIIYDLMVTRIINVTMLFFGFLIIVYSARLLDKLSKDD